MGKRSLSTPRSKVRSALRQLWLRSRERAAALKREGYCCEDCGIKQSAAKGREVRLEVHHVREDGIEWGKMIDYVYRHLLCDPKELEVLCQPCHKQRHEEGN